MEDLDDLPPSKLRQLAEDWAALAYAVRNSPIHDEDFMEMMAGTAWADDFEVIRDCSEASTATEDAVLGRGWMFGQLEQELDNDVDRE